MNWFFERIGHSMDNNFIFLNAAPEMDLFRAFLP